MWRHKFARQAKWIGHAYGEAGRQNVCAIAGSTQLKEGEVVRESRLARQWNLSRTPLRQAVRRASECGYLVLRPNEAPMVRRLTAADFRHIYSLRELLECFALKSAWANLPHDEITHLLAMVRQIDWDTIGDLIAVVLDILFEFFAFFCGPFSCLAARQRRSGVPVRSSA